MNPGAIWKSDWFAGTIITLLFLLAYQQHVSILQNFENQLYDLVSGHAEQGADKQIVIVNIDEKSISGMGQQPQFAIASVINELSEAGVSLIGLDVLYSEAELTTDTEAGPEKQLTLVEATMRSGNTLMPMYFDAGSAGEYSNIVLPNYIRRLIIKHINTTDVFSEPISATNLSYPYAALTQASAGIGHLSVFMDNDGVTRSEPLAIEFSGQYFPSMSLALAAKALHVPLNDIRINLGQDIELGAMNIVTDAKLRVYPTFYYDQHGNSFSSYPFHELLSGNTPASMFKNKIVLIGTASQQPGARLATPANTQMSRIEFSAHTLQSILNNQFYSRPAWTAMLEAALLLLAGLYLIFLLPRLNGTIAIAATGLLCIAFIVTGIVLLAAFSLWLQLIGAALLLIVGHLCFYLLQFYASKKQHSHSSGSLNETNKMLGFSFQSQGMLDKAYEKFLACPLDDEMYSILYDLAQAFERKRQFKRAIEVYNHIGQYNPGYKDIQTRMINAKSSDEALSNKDSSSGLSSLLNTGEARPVLGRYEIISELGKGAMGTVYLGKDPKINRQVAIKTMALSQEFEPDELEEVKAKFFHEAEIAGMLNHQNIVTIFDAGDEHDLAYIAMEFLDGIDLVPYTKKDKLLPFTTTLKIVAKVAEALQYAHEHGVIHRDIKPANIMILKNKTVKVTDFGIAHINESSKTKAGVVLGTPSYMSPEQLSGKELDGRSDLFSLGVMLYELVSGVRPFKGDSISKLMFKIAKEPHVNVQENNPDVPDSVRTLIDSMLAKKVDLRIETANEVLDKISICLRDLKSQEDGL